tara:strand:- start:82 stop:225 length:144 start_codon:yes stop_codon:yes gene_type:complete
MWKASIPLSDVLRMVDLIKQINIEKCGQEEYREIVSFILTSTVTEKD